MVPSLSLRALAFLLGSPWLVRSVDVSLNFYTTPDCKTASTITPSANLNLSTCFVSPGLVSLHYATVPCAGGGTVVPYLFSDTSCGDQQTILDWYKTGSDFHCHSDYDDGSIAAFMLSCNQDKPEKPAATSTVNVGAVATGAAAPTSTSKGSSSSGNSDSGNSSSNNDDNNKSGWNALSLGARIGIIVAAAVVGLALAIGFIVRLINHRPPRPVPPPDYRPPYRRYDESYKEASTATRQVTSPVDRSQVGSPVRRPVPGEDYLQQQQQQQQQQRWDELAGRDRQQWELADEEARLGQDIPPLVPPTELPGEQLTSATAYRQVLENAATSGAQHAADGLFDTGTQTYSLRNYSAAVASNVISAAFDKRDPDWKHKRGAAGELYMFEYLKGLNLPNFGLRNWTSSLRTLVSDHPDYHDIGTCRNSIADIEYYDERGAFTSFLVDNGYESQGIHRGMRPTYRFEVKATPSPNWQMPFYMSDTQEEHIRDFIITPGHTESVYIVCRVFNLGGGSRTGLNIYLDPESLRRQGRLHFTRDSNEGDANWTVRPV